MGKQEVRPDMDAVHKAVIKAADAGQAERKKLAKRMVAKLADEFLRLGVPIMEPIGAGSKPTAAWMFATNLLTRISGLEIHLMFESVRLQCDVAQKQNESEKGKTPGVEWGKP